MASLRNWFNSFESKTGERITHVQFFSPSLYEWEGKTYDQDWMEEERDVYPKPSWVVGKCGDVFNYADCPSEILDYEFNDGFGSPDAPAVIAFSKSFILYIHEYDGAENLQWFPRNPVPFTLTKDTRFE